MPTKSKKQLTVAIPPPVGGINLNTSIEKLQPIEAINLSNFEFDEYGTIGMPRPPKSLGAIIATANTWCLSAIIFQRRGAATQLIVHLSDGTIRYSTDFHTTTTTATWTTIASGVNGGSPFSMVNWLDKIWMCNGVDDFRSWDGTTQVTYATAPKCYYLTVWKDTMWLAGQSANPSRVYSSAPGDPTTWPALNFIDVDKGAGRGIWGLADVETALVIFSPLKTYVLYDPVEYANRLVDPSKGCISNFSIVTHNGQMYFASHLGFCRFLGDGPSEIISQKLEPMFQERFLGGTGLGTYYGAEITLEARIAAVSFENYLAWTFYFGTNGPVVIKYYPDLPDKPWMFSNVYDSSLGTYFSTGVLIAVREPNKQGQLYEISGYTTGPKLVRVYGGAIGDDLVDCKWNSAWFDFDSPDVEKYVYMIEIDHRGALDTVALRRDLMGQNDVSAPGYKVVAAPQSGASYINTSRIYTDFYCKLLQIIILCTGAALSQSQQVLDGSATTTNIQRFGASIAGVRVYARPITEMLA